MNVHAIAIGVVLALAVLCAAVSCAGIVAMRTTMQRLHFVGPLAMLAPVLFALAESISQKPLSAPALKADFIALTLVLFAPVLTHATGRAAVSRAQSDD